MLAAPAARGHVVAGTTTIRTRTLESDLVARVRIVDANAFIEIEKPLLREALVVAEVLGLLKGNAPGEPLRFVQHGHGVPKYENGEEVVVFAKRIERSRELASSPIVPTRCVPFSAVRTGARPEATTPPRTSWCRPTSTTSRASSRVTRCRA